MNLRTSRKLKNVIISIICAILNFLSYLSSFLKNIRVSRHENLFIFFWTAIKIAGSAQKTGSVRLAETHFFCVFFRPYIISGTFPSKAEWKQRCKTAIWTYEESAWRTRLAESNEFARFRTIQTELKSATLWTLALNRSDTLEFCTFVV